MSKKQHYLFIVSSPAYGNDNFLMSLRLALQLQEEQKGNAQINLFLISDAVTGALAKQQPSEGFHLQEMLELLISRGAQIKLCTTCCNARGVTGLELAKGVELSTMLQLAQWTVEADKVLNF